MLQKPLPDIVGGDIDALVAEGVSESRTLEYKRDMPGNTSGDKKEFLADVSSLANSLGGDLIIGIEEAAGVASRIAGVTLANPDAEIQRLENMLATGLSPRVRCAIRRVSCGTSLEVLVIRVDSSWNAPHRVTFEGSDKFYARNTNGKYPMDVIELRDAFLKASSVSERLRAFHERRVAEIAGADTPVPVGQGAKLVLHLLPMSAFASPDLFDVQSLIEHPDRVRPMSARSWNHRITFEGALTYSPFENGTPAYTHVFRSGIVEAVDGYILNIERNGKRYIPSVTYEKLLIDAVGSLLQVQAGIGVRPPIAVHIALIDAKGCWMGTANSFYDMSDRYPIDRDRLLLPGLLVNDFTVPVVPLLRPALDAVWNACGYPKSQNFNDKGDWAPERG